jgi:hypothetical protein
MTRKEILTNWLNNLNSTVFLLICFVSWFIVIFCMFYVIHLMLGLHDIINIKEHIIIVSILSLFFASTTTTTRNSEKQQNKYYAGLSLIEQEARQAKSKEELLDIKYKLAKYFNSNAQTSNQTGKAQKVMTIINTRLEYEFKYNSNEEDSELEDRNF